MEHPSAKRTGHIGSARPCAGRPSERGGAAWPMTFVTTIVAPGYWALLPHMATVMRCVIAHDTSQECAGGACRFYLGIEGQASGRIDGDTTHRPPEESPDVG